MRRTRHRKNFLMRFTTEACLSKYSVNYVGRQSIADEHYWKRHMHFCCPTPYFSVSLSYICAAPAYRSRRRRGWSQLRRKGYVWQSLSRPGSYWGSKPGHLSAFQNNIKSMGFFQYKPTTRCMLEAAA